MSIARKAPARRSASSVSSSRKSSGATTRPGPRTRRAKAAPTKDFCDGVDPRVAERLQRLLAEPIAFIANDSFVGRRDSATDASEFCAGIERGEGPGASGGASGLPAHLSRMCATPLLTPDEEREVFRRMNFCKYRANAIRSRISVGNPDAERVREVEDYLRRAETLRNHIVSANTRLVISIARRFADARNAFDDLLSQGIASLMHSVDKFDYDRGYRFSTYATCAVRRDLYRAVMGKKKDSQRFTTGTDEYLTSCTDYRVDESDLTEAGYKRLREALGEMLETLDERERLIVVSRFGLDGSPKKTSYSRLGERLGISKERVRQLANRAMDKMREIVPEYRLEGLLG